MTETIAPPHRSGAALAPVRRARGAWLAALCAGLMGLAPVAQADPLADPLADPALASAVLALEIGAAAEDPVLLAGALAALTALGVADARPGAGPLAEAGAALAFLARGAPAGADRAAAATLHLSRLGDAGPGPRGPVLVVFADAGRSLTARDSGACAALRPWAWLCREALPDLPQRAGAALLVEPAR